jgi:hypothetical protein
MVDRAAEAAPPASTSVEANGVTFAWGTPALWKARWRDESLRRHLELSMRERLRSALGLVLRRSNRDQRST